ncbi:unnamed protein product, partial [Allacma fusca]
LNFLMVVKVVGEGRTLEDDEAISEEIGSSGCSSLSRESRTHSTFGKCPDSPFRQHEKREPAGICDGILRGRGSRPTQSSSSEGGL